jgi:hypothetical protein
VSCDCGKRIQLWVSAWIKEGRKGKFLSLSFKKRDPQASRKPADNADIEFFND